jgi:hypothetical protein
MTVVEMNKLIGTRGVVEVGNDTLAMKVEVVGVRQSYGYTQVQVKPISGRGYGWMALVYVRFEGE